MDPWRSSQWVGDAHLAYQSTNFRGYSWSAAATPRFTAPIRSKPSTMPTDHSVWPDNCQSIIDGGKQSVDPSQYQPVNRDEAQPPQHIEWLPQHHNLCLKRSTRPEKVDDHPKDRSAQL